MSKLSDAIKGIGGLAVDFTELEVITLTGQLKADHVAAANDSDKSSTRLKWADLVGEATTKPTGSVILAASTVIKFDGDSYKFVSSDERVTPAHLEAHEAAVQAAMQTRAALMTFFRDTIRAAVN